MKYFIEYHSQKVLYDKAFVGPFDSEREAYEAGRKYLHRYAWFIRELVAFDKDNLPLLEEDFKRMSPRTGLAS